MCDSNGAKDFVLQCVDEIREKLPKARIETRVDSGSSKLLSMRSTARGYSSPPRCLLSVLLKSMLQGRRRWRRIDEELSFFESQWKPNRWSERYRFVFIRKRVRRQNKMPIQLDLFVPHEEGYDFKVIVTNKRVRAKRVVRFHEGRGSQEEIFAELKSQMDYVPVTTRVGLGLGDARAQPHSGAADDRPPTATRNHRQAYGALGLRETPNDQA